jgi:hypothetical protein
MSDKHLYKIVFVDQDQVYEVYVKNVYQGELYGFVVIEDFVFGEKSAIVVDPTEEKLRNEFDGIIRSFIPLHKIIRIDQVKKRGSAKILSLGKDSTEGLNNVSSLYRKDKK